VDEFGLSSAHRSAIVEALRRVLAPGQPLRVWLFGSRVRGTQRVYSDVDLLVDRGTPLTPHQLAAAREAFENSALPFKIDLVDEADLYEGYAARVSADRRLFVDLPTPCSTRV
jgi:predicted nucleotidyltransferase